MAIVGPGAVVQDEIAPSATLEKAGEYEYVTILNPLPDDFAILVAQDVPVNMPMHIRSGTGGVQTESDLLRTYGDTFKNPDFKAKKHIANQTVIKAGQTINLKGNEAQVAVRQLVNEILQREGEKRMLADPTKRKQVEDRIIKHRGLVQDLMDQGLQSQRSQLDEAINRSNEAHNEEVAFPGVGQAAGSQEAAASDTANDNTSQPKRMGRPKKTDS